MHLGLQAVVCLILMHTLPKRQMGKYVSIFAMGYLCFCHIYRLYTDYGGYTLDITGLALLFYSVIDFNVFYLLILYCLFLCLL